MSEEEPATASEATGAPGGATARRLLGIRALWITPIAIASVLIVLMTLVYVGSVVSPTSHLHGLPVLVVDQDRGGSAQGRTVDLGRQVTSALTGTPAVASRLGLRSMTLGAARRELNRNGAYAAIVIPSGFTASTLALYGIGAPGAGAPALPTIQLLTNVRSGSLGVGLATGVAQPALAAISRQVGHALTGQAPASAFAGSGATLGIAALRANPIAVTTTQYRPLPDHSAQGLSAFYVALLTIMCGFLGATLINSTVDAALGYATTEIGPRWSQRMPVAISRWQTLLTKWLMAVVLCPLLTGILLLVSIAVLGMDASSVGLLWLFIALAAIVIALGTLVLFAALGALGQLVALLLFIYLALASSGGTVPLEALPGVLKAVANFEPLRQVLDGVRSILYFGAKGDAGLTRGFVMTGVGFVLWLVLGVAITTFYDRRGLDRLEPELLSYVSRSVRGYREQQAAPEESP